MTVGQQNSKTTFDQFLTNTAVALRNWVQSVQDQNTQINSQNNGIAVLVAMGYDNSVAGGTNGLNPGGQTDAAFALAELAEFMNVAGVCSGTIYQGTQPGNGNCILYNFLSAFAPLMAGK
jgi:hypothetical protein